LKVVVDNKAAFESEFIARVNALESAMANKVVAVSRLSEVKGKIERFERERCAALDNLAKIAQSNSAVSSRRDQRKCAEVTAELDRLDVQLKDCDESVQAAKESLQQAVDALLEYLEQTAEIKK